MLEVRVGRVGDPPLPLVPGEGLGHPLEVRGPAADGGAQVGRRHEDLVEVGLLREEAERQAALAHDLAPIRFVATRCEPEQRRLAGAVGPDEADPVAQRERDVDPVEDDERPDLAGDLGEAEDRHQADPAPVPDAARAAARRVAAARFVRSVRERAVARAASSGVTPRLPSPGSSVQRRPRRRAPPVIVRRIVRAPARSVAGRRWHHEQKWVLRAPTTIRRSGRPQRGHGSPVRW